MSSYYQILIVAVLAVVAAWIYALVWLSLWKRSLKAISAELQSAIWDTKKIQDNLRRTVETVEILKRNVQTPWTPSPMNDAEFIKKVDEQMAYNRRLEEAHYHIEDSLKRRKAD